MLDVKGSSIVGKHYSWKNDLRYQMLLLEDRVLFIRDKSVPYDAIGIIIYILLLITISSFGGAYFGIIGAMAGAFIAAIIGGIPFGLLLNKRKKRNEEIRKSIPDSVDYALHADKKNFQIMYDEIKKTEVQGASMKRALAYGANKGILIINGSERIEFDIMDDKFEELKSLASLYLKG
jgi:hypothetical protein